MKLIDASVLNRAIEEWFDGVCVYDVCPSEAIMDFQNIVDDMPAIEAIPIAWIKQQPIFQAIAVRAMIAKWHEEQG